MSTDDPIFCASYERVSTRMQGQFGFSLGAQEGSTEEFVNRYPGWTLRADCRYRDGEEWDASGADWDLPGLTRMLSDAREGKFTKLIVPDLDRFARSLVKGMVLEEQLKHYGVDVVYQRLPIGDSLEGNLLKQQLFSFAEYERLKFALRSITGRREKARRGMPVGTGPAPYGYRYAVEPRADGRPRVVGLEIDPEAAEVVRRIFGLLETLTCWEVCDVLNADGIPAPAAGRARRRRKQGDVLTLRTEWGPSTILRMATNPVYRGCWTYGKAAGKALGRDRAEGALVIPVPALVDPADWERIQTELIGRKKARRSPAADDPFVLRGALVCGCCGDRLQTTVSCGVRYYKCPRHDPSTARIRGRARCPLPYVNAEGIEASAMEAVRETLLEPAGLAAAFAEARARETVGNRVAIDRRAVAAGGAARARRRIAALVEELSDAKPAVREAIRRQLDALAAEEERYEAEIATLDTAASRESRWAPTAAEEATVGALAARLRVGLAEAGAAEWRRGLAALGVLGTIRPATEGEPGAERYGRKHWYVPRWAARVRLAGGDLLSPGESYHYLSLAFSSRDLVLLPAAD